jgi:hypothetical protein
MRKNRRKYNQAAAKQDAELQHLAELYQEHQGQPIHEAGPWPVSWQHQEVCLRFGQLEPVQQLVQLPGTDPGQEATMEIDKIWTIKVWNGSAKYPRIFLNADVIDDNTLLALFHNASKHRYEYWKITQKR